MGNIVIAVAVAKWCLLWAWLIITDDRPVRVRLPMAIVVSPDVEGP